MSAKRQPRNVRATVIGVDRSGLVTISYPSVHSNTPDNVTTFSVEPETIAQFSVGSMISFWHE